MKRRICFPPFYHPKDNIEFKIKDDTLGTIYHIISTEMKYDLSSGLISYPEYWAEDKAKTMHKPVKKNKIIPIGKTKFTYLNEEYDFRREYPRFTVDFYGEIIEITPGTIITFEFSIKPPLEIKLETDRWPVDLNAKGDVIYKENQKIIKWLPI